MVSVARKNLFHDKTRLAMGLGGILFAVVLMGFAVGMLFGTFRYAVELVDRSTAQVWLVSQKTRDFLSPAPFPDEVAGQVRQVPGVAGASKLIMASYSANATGGQSSPVYLVGFDPEVELGLPWDVATGSAADLRRDMTVILDRSALREFGPLQVGDKIEMGDQVVEVVGFSRNAAWMLGMPYAFASAQTAQAVLHSEGQTLAVLVQAEHGADVAMLMERLSAVEGVEVLTQQDVHDRSMDAWLTGTPVGYMSGAMVLIGFLVGLTVVGLTLYTATVERTREYGVMKAIGASNWDVYRVVLEQAAILSMLGYGMGVLGALGVGRLYASLTGMGFAVPILVLAGMLLAVLTMSGIAALFAMRKVATIDLALVFKA